MKKFIALIAAPLLAVSLSAQADSADDGQRFCKLIHELSASVMRSRQSGVSMPKMIEVADGHALNINLVQQAYLYPRYSTAEVKRRTVQDFANDRYRDCLFAFTNQ